MRGLKSLLVFLVICWINLSEARPQPEKLSPAVVVGTVYCDTCFQDDFSKGTHYISGAIAAVECEEKSYRPAFYQEVKTNKQGKFKVHLPFSLSKDTKEIQGCTIKLVKSNDPDCAIASTVKNSSTKIVHFKEITKQGKHIFSAGFFTFKPSKNKLEKCNEKLPNSYKNSLFPNYPQIPTFPIPIPNPNPNQPLLPELPPLPPLPELPPLPPLPPLPQLPSLSSMIPKIPSVEKEKITPYQFTLIPPVISPPSTGLPLPPNPLQPAPLLPNPLQPPSTPLIPNPFQPPAPPTGSLPVPPLPSLPLPPVPGVTPPPPPASSLPLPRLPIPLIPGIPIPPTASSVGPKKKTP